MKSDFIPYFVRVTFFLGHTVVFFQVYEQSTRKFALNFKLTRDSEKFLL